MKDLRNIRKDYQIAKLELAAVSPDPFVQFALWYEDIEKIACVSEPNAMVLATVNEQQQPSARILLLKGFNHEGFIFFTNYQSRKGQDLATNNRVATVFYWPELERQVRIEGLVEKTDEQTSEEYFNARPVGSQVSAMISPQSQVVDRALLEKKHLELLDIVKHDTSKSQRPDFWGGYRLKPQMFEFWQGRSDRLHDRICYHKNADNWSIECLAP